MKDVLRRLVNGDVSLDEAERLLRLSVIEEVDDFARLDICRGLRKGIPEIILAEGKNESDLLQIILKIVECNGRVIVSRVSPDQVKSIKQALAEDIIITESERATTIVIKKCLSSVEKTGGKIGILTAGTSDIPVAEESKLVAEEMGCDVTTAYDVGVAGIHRLFIPLKTMVENNVDVLIVVAGREGALPSLIAGLSDIPIIAVPTSIGYGFGGKGVAALTAMLQACPLGLAVVNIDAGVAAGAMAALMANRVAQARIDTIHPEEYSPVTADRLV